MKKLTKILPAFLILCVSGIPLIVLAAVVVSGETTVMSFICNLLRIIRNIITAVGFAIAVIILIVGAVTYMTAGGDAEKATKGRKLIINAVIGIAILLAVIFIITLVAGLLTGSATFNPFTDPCGQVVY